MARMASFASIGRTACQAVKQLSDAAGMSKRLAPTSSYGLSSPASVGASARSCLAQGLGSAPGCRASGPGLSAGAAEFVSMSPMGGCFSMRGLSSSSEAAAAAAGGGGSLVGDEEDDDPTTKRNSSETNAAAAAMADPLSRLMASRGMPLGMSPHTLSDRIAAQFEEDDLLASQKPKPEPGYQMEAIDEIFPNAAAAAVSASLKRGAEGGQAGPKSDAWGTTREGPVEIARRIMENNAGIIDDEALPNPEVDEMQLSPSEAKYKTLEEMSTDIKNLDEVFEVLASVPWLDEMDVAQKQLKGVAMVGLLGTLEEVGFDIRTQVEKIWAGDRDQNLAIQCAEAKDQAALISILFHTKKLEEEFGSVGPCYPPKAFEGWTK